MANRSGALLARLCVIALVVSMLLGCAGATPTATGPEEATGRTPKPTFTPKPTVAPDAPAAELPTATSVETEPEQAPTATAVEANAEPTEDEGGDESADTPDPTEPLAPTDAPVEVKSLRMNSPEYGMQAFMWWRPEVGSRDLQKVNEAGFTWVKTNFGWRDIEGAGKGVYDWSHTDPIVKMANDDGIDLLVRIDHQPGWSGGGFPTNGPPDNYQDLYDFMYAIASRYKGRVRAYEVWNEPNLSREWGGQLPDPVAYAELLKGSYAAIKAADPNAMVISAGLSPTGSWTEEARPDDWYLSTLYEVMKGGSDGYFDVLGVHGPGYRVSPETDPAVVEADPNLGGHRAFCFRRVEDLREIMEKYGDSDKQVALLEFGWTSDPRPDSPYNWHAVSEETKADYLVRAYQYARENWSPWIGMMSLIYICDPDWTTDHEQYYWAINDPSYPEFTPRPAYTALKNMPK